METQISGQITNTIVGVIYQSPDGPKYCKCIPNELRYKTDNYFGPNHIITFRGDGPASECYVHDTEGNYKYKIVGDIVCICWDIWVVQRKSGGYYYKDAKSKSEKVEGTKDIGYRPSMDLIYVDMKKYEEVLVVPDKRFVKWYIYGPIEIDYKGIKSEGFYGNEELWDHSKTNITFRRLPPLKC